MIYTCDVCGRDKNTKRIVTEGGIIHVCNWCINSNKLCPLGCANKDISCINCVDMCNFKKKYISKIVWITCKRCGHIHHSGIKTCNVCNIIDYKYKKVEI